MKKIFVTLFIAAFALSAMAQQPAQQNNQAAPVKAQPAQVATGTGAVTAENPNAGDFQFAE